MADLIIRFMNEKMVELRFSRYSESKAFQLISVLVRRVFEDVFKPCIGILPALKAKNHIQVATTIFYSSFKSLSIMKNYKELHIFPSTLLSLWNILIF